MQSANIRKSPSIGIICFLKDYRNELQGRRKTKDFRLITEGRLFGPQRRDYVPVFRRHKIEVVHIVPDPALVDPHINGLLPRRRRVVVFDYRNLRGFGIGISGTGIIPAVICGSRRVLTELIYLQIARPFERRAERSSVTERIVRINISIIIRVGRSKRNRKSKNSLKKCLNNQELLYFLYDTKKNCAE